MDAIEIVPGQSIGGVRIGLRAEELPKQATLSGPRGELNGIFFLVVDGKVDDVWIDDLRKTERGVRVAGRLIAPDASLDEVKRSFGTCKKVPDVKGGVFFNCDAGVAIGCDFSEEGQFIQIRLKSR